MEGSLSGEWQGRLECWKDSKDGARGERSKLGCPHTFPVRCQILCGNQSPICLKAAGSGKVPISDVRVRVGVVEESGLQARGPWGRFRPWMGGGLGGLQLSRPFHHSGCGAWAGQAFLLLSKQRAASSGGCQACPNCAPGCLNFASPR